MFNKAFTRHSVAEVLLSLPKVPKSAFCWQGIYHSSDAKAEMFSEKGQMNKFSLPPQSAVENVFTYCTTEKFHFAPLKKVFSLHFPSGFPVVHFYAHTKMRPPSLRALYWYKYLKGGGKRDEGISSELLDLWA